MITKSNFILRQVYTAIATLVLMLMLVGGGLYILQTKRYDLELNVSHYHLSSIALASGAKERLLHAKEAIVGLDSFDSSAIGGLVYLVGKDLSNLQKIQEDFNSQEFVFILDTIDERFDDLSALGGKEDFPRDPFFKLTASLILEFDRLARLHQVGASESSAQIDQVENEIYPVLFAILFLSLSVGGWRLKLSIYRIKKMIAGSRKQEELTTRFGRILDNSSNEIYVFDASTLHFIQVNSGARENLGYSMDELTHMTPLSFKPEYTLETFEKLIEPLRSGKKSVIGFETVHKRKDGMLYPVEVKLQLMHKETPPVFIAVIQDITMRKQTEEKLGQYRDHLEELVEERTQELEKSQEQLLHSEKLSALGKLTGSISHEFNNPLQGLRNIIGILSDSAPSEQEVKLAELGKKECDRMAKMIVSLRSFYKPSSGKISAVGINQCMEDTIILVAKSLQEKNIRVNKKYSNNLPKVEVVEDQIKQILLNLISNASEAISEDGGQIILTTEAQGSCVIMKVRDTGSGISAEDKKKVFEPFFTTKGGKGTGLGLSISYGIIQDHGGSIEVESELGDGTTFTVSLPVKRV